jgi:predicted lipoprotein with Yx(FWY)xxD motif
MRTLRILPAFAAVAAMVVAAGCGSSGGSGGAYGGGGSSTSKPAAPASGAAKVDLRKTDVGTVLVGPNGRTLYLFEKDKGTTSSCAGECASVWPPLLTDGKPSAGAGVSAAMLGTTKAAGGKTMVTYNGHPLYYYVSDTKPGQTAGQGLDQFGAEWYVLGANGSKLEKGEKSESGDDKGGSEHESGDDNGGSGGGSGSSKGSVY